MKRHRKGPAQAAGTTPSTGCLRCGAGGDDWFVIAVVPLSPAQAAKQQRLQQQLGVSIFVGTCSVCDAVLYLGRRTPDTELHRFRRIVEGER